MQRRGLSTKDSILTWAVYRGACKAELDEDDHATAEYLAECVRKAERLDNADMRAYVRLLQALCREQERLAAATQLAAARHKRLGEHDTAQLMMLERLKLALAGPDSEADK